MPPKKSNRVVARYNYNAQEEGDLSFKKGDVITVTRKTHDTNDWWEGTLDGKSGQVI